MIEFLCPNGHKIRCPTERAGQAAKCPRCGVKFRIPDPADLDASDAFGSDTNISRPEFTESSVDAMSPPKPEDVPENVPEEVSEKEPEIGFLCPNGHRLHGPASLQGRPGECPECGARFRIPNYEEPSVEEGTGGIAQETDPGQIEGGDSTAIEAAENVPPDVGGIVSDASVRGRSGPSMADLFSRLWDARPQGTIVEIRLRNGDSVVPHQFLKKLVRQEAGVFTVREADGTLTLTAVAWEAIAQVAIRGLKDLPEELAE